MALKYHGLIVLQDNVLKVPASLFILGKYEWKCIRFGMRVIEQKVANYLPNEGARTPSQQAHRLPTHVLRGPQDGHWHAAQKSSAPFKWLGANEHVRYCNILVIY